MQPSITTFCDETALAVNTATVYVSD